MAQVSNLFSWDVELKNSPEEVQMVFRMMDPKNLAWSKTAMLGWTSGWEGELNPDYFYRLGRVEIYDYHKLTMEDGKYHSGPYTLEHLRNKETFVGLVMKSFSSKSVIVMDKTGRYHAGFEEGDGYNFHPFKILLGNEPMMPIGVLMKHE